MFALLVLLVLLLALGYRARASRAARALALALLLTAGACTAWLRRDPVPYFLDRRATSWVVSGDTVASGAGHANEQLRVVGANGLAFAMQLRRPAADSGTVRRPVFVILGGYQTGDRAATLIPDTHGMIVVALGYPYAGDVNLKGVAVIPAVPALRRAILDTPPAILLAIDYLWTRPDVDTSRIELIGASFGTPFAVTAGALDRRIARVWSLHGAAWPYRQIELNLRRQIPLAVLRAPVAALATLCASGWALDPERWVGRISPREFVMINARDDERMPRDAVEALYRAARPPRELIWLDGPHVQSNRREVLAGLVSRVLERAATLPTPVTP